MIMLRTFKLQNVRNRGYVIDSQGNKLFFGTEYQCRKFIEYLEKELTKDDEHSSMEPVRKTKP